MESEVRFMWLRWWIGLVLASLLLFLAPQTRAEGMDIFVSIPPQAFFVERIAGDLADVHIMVGPGQSPHAFEPTPKQLARMSEAKIYFAIGLPFERRLLQKVQSMSPGLRIVHTEEGVSRRSIGGHGHGAKGATDPHIWLSPKLVKMQAVTIAKALEVMDPAHAGKYRNNLRRFIASLDRVDSKIGHELAPFRGRAFYVYHPALGYFADAYGLVEVPIEREGKQPGASGLAAVITGAKECGAKTIFVEPQFPRRQAAAIARAIGGDVVGLDPLAEDYLTNLESMAEKIREALKKEKK
jgi:zinc transport system substrate-binding protein